MNAGENRRAAAAEPRANSPGPIAVRQTATSRVGRFCAGQRTAAICEKPSAVATAAAAGSAGDRLGHPLGLGGDFRQAAAEHPQRGHLAEGLRLVEEQAQRGLQGGQRELPHADDAGQNGLLRTAWTSAALARNDPALAAADQFIGAGRDQIGPAFAPIPASVGPMSKPKREKSTSAPAPTSSITTSPRSWAIRTSSASGTSDVKPESCNCSGGRGEWRPCRA